MIVFITTNIYNLQQHLDAEPRLKQDLCPTKYSDCHKPKIRLPFQPMNILSLKEFPLSIFIVHQNHHKLLPFSSILNIYWTNCWSTARGKACIPRIRIQTISSWSLDGNIYLLSVRIHLLLARDCCIMLTRGVDGMQIDNPWCSLEIMCN